MLPWYNSCSKASTHPQVTHAPAGPEAGVRRHILKLAVPARGELGRAVDRAADAPAARNCLRTEPDETPHCNTATEMIDSASQSHAWWFTRHISHAHCDTFHITNTDKPAAPAREHATQRLPLPPGLGRWQHRPCHLATDCTPAPVAARPPPSPSLLRAVTDFPSHSDARLDAQGRRQKHVSARGSYGK